MTKKRIFAGLLLAGLVVTQAQASWLNNAWQTLSSSVMQLKRNGLIKTVSNHPLAVAAVFVAPFLCWATQHVYRKWKPRQTKKIGSPRSHTQINTNKSETQQTTQSGTQATTDDTQTQNQSSNKEDENSISSSPRPQDTQLMNEIIQEYPEKLQKEGSIVPQIMDFDFDRDAGAIRNIIDENAQMKWFIALGNMPEFVQNPRVQTRTNVLRTTDHLIGFITYYKTSSIKGTIMYFGISSAFHHQGFGRRLLQYAIDDLVNQGTQSIELWVRPENNVAQIFYKKFGFKETQRLKYNNDIVHSIVMEWAVSTTSSSSQANTQADPERIAMPVISQTELSEELGIAPGTLHEAVYNGNEDLVDERIAQIDLENGNGLNLLNIAAQRGHARIVQKLGNRYTRSLNDIRDEEANTALHYAAKYCRDEVVNVLTNDSIKFPIGSNYQEEVNRILVNAENKYGDTALHEAARHGHENIVRLLLGRGAKNLANLQGNRPSDLAHPTIKDQIIQATALGPTPPQLQRSIDNEINSHRNKDTTLMPANTTQIEDGSITIRLVPSLQQGTNCFCGYYAFWNAYMFSLGSAQKQRTNRTEFDQLLKVMVTFIAESRNLQIGPLDNIGPGPGQLGEEGLRRKFRVENMIIVETDQLPHGQTAEIRRARSKLDEFKQAGNPNPLSIVVGIPGHWIAAVVEKEQGHITISVANSIPTNIQNMQQSIRGIIAYLW